MKNHRRRVVLVTGLLLLVAGCGSGADDGSSSSADALLPIVNQCGNEFSAPAIRSATIVAPNALDANGNAPPGWRASSGRMVASGIQYVSGGALRVDLVTDGCTSVTSVQMGPHTITTTPSGGYTLTVIDGANDSSQHVMTVWLHFPAVGDGTTDDVTITVNRIDGRRSAAYSFPLVHVKAVQPIGLDAPIGIAETEIYDQLSTALFAQFGGAANSTVVNGRRLYGYDQSSLSSQIDDGGISVRFTFMADVANWCDPTITVHGTFVLDTNAPDKPGLSVRWVSPIQADMDWGICGALGDIPDLMGAIARLVYALIGDDGAAGTVQQELTDEITNALPPANFLLDGTFTHAGELRIYFKTLSPSVEIDVPYDAFDMAPRATRFPKSTTVALFAAGLGMTDTIAGSSATLVSGPNGVPLHTASTIPNAHTVARAGALVDATSPVGRLLAQTTDGGGITTTFRYGGACGVPVPGGTVISGAPFVRFGVNDTAADAARLRAAGAPGYSVRALFGAVGGGCDAFGGTGVVGSTGAVTR